ncbi:MFS transporter [Lactiplantibacillus pentosus]|uniref:MFS transporter n=1 Tax=Lactiplantibacillus pentosus TaxID=1589 RepID=A0AAW8VTT0_LACPE|nr:MFS transporter [Lactiplantibacillus pentosus]MBU7475500.1 MFS transporter [Lactiplantibacillus pentosus]MBU7530814.1 MFS transporter [Lactiplantibacillus pentosus]MDT6989606.1 MFS transporter [Lactiplantibacillus pentosus]
MNVRKQVFQIMGAIFFGNFGSSVFSFATSLYILQRTGSALGMGFTLIISPIVTLLMTPYIGYVVDSFNHKKILVFSQLGTIVALIIFGFLLIKFAKYYFVELIVLLVFLKIADSFLQNTLQSSVTQLVPKENFQQLNSMVQSSNSLATVVSPLVGAVLFSIIPFGYFAFFEVISEIVTLYLILLVKFGTQQSRGVSGRIGESFISGLQFMRKNSMILVVSLFIAGLNFFMAAMNVGLPYLQIHVLKLSTQQYGLTESSVAIGMVLGGIIFQLFKRQFSVPNAFSFMIMFAVILSSLGVPIFYNIGSSATTIFYCFANLVLGCLVIFINTPLIAYFQTEVPADYQGRVFSIQATIASLLIPIGTVIYGVLFDLISGTWIFLGSGITLALISLVAVIRILKSKTEEDVIAR